MYKGPEWEAKSRHQDKQGGMHQESCVCFGMGLGVGGASPVALVVKNPSANAGDKRDVGLITGLGRSPGEGHGNQYCILAWRIPWTEEPGRLQSLGSHRVGHD